MSVSPGTGKSMTAQPPLMRIFSRTSGFSSSLRIISMIGSYFGDAGDARMLPFIEKTRSSPWYSFSKRLR